MSYLLSKDYYVLPVGTFFFFFFSYSNQGNGLYGIEQQQWGGQPQQQSPNMKSSTNKHIYTSR
jgi:hypothetical protein